MDLNKITFDDFFTFKYTIFQKYLIIHLDLHVTVKYLKLHIKNTRLQFRLHESQYPAVGSLMLKDNIINGSNKNKPKNHERIN